MANKITKDTMKRLIEEALTLQDVTNSAKQKKDNGTSRDKAKLSLLMQYRRVGITPQLIARALDVAYGETTDDSDDTDGEGDTDNSDDTDDSDDTDTDDTDDTDTDDTDDTDTDDTGITYDFKDNSIAVKNALTATFGANISKTILSKIAGLKEGALNEDPSKFEIEDIEDLMQKAIAHPKTDKALKGRKKTAANNKRVVTGKDNVDIATQVDAELKKFINKVKDPAMARKLTKAKIDYDKAVQSSRGLNPEIDTTYAASSRIGMPASIGGDIKPPVDPVVFKSFETFFAGKTTFNARLTHLKKFSEAIVKASNGKPSPLDAFSPEVIITGGNVMSMISKLTRQMDPSAGGYFAEAFLAYLVGGSKTGQAQGAGDFKGADEKDYSSKWGSSSKKQASSNFTKLNSRITYITADKATEDKVGTSKTMKVLKLTLKVYDIITTGVGTVGSGDSAGFKIELGAMNFTKGNGQTRRPAGGSGNRATGDYDVSPPSDAKEYVVTLVSASDEVFDQVFSKAVNNISSQVVKAAARFTALSRQLEENTTNYSVSSDFTEAVQMADTYAEIKNELATIYTGKTGESDATRIGLAEQKITADFLKKLISESFKR